MINYDFTQYIDEDFCREERQYALFLYNIFLHKKTGIALTSEFEQIVNTCLLGDTYSAALKIDAVYYEAAFLRDYFKADRERILKENGISFSDSNISMALSALNQKADIGNDYFTDSFNHKLLEFCIETETSVPDKKALAEDIIQTIREKGYLLHNWGNKEVYSLFKNMDPGSDKTRVMTIIKMMMHSKPDIAVIYSFPESNEKILRLFECKYLSGESGTDRVKQRVIQDKIAAFMCSGRTDIKADDAHLSPNSNRILNFRKDITEVSITDNDVRIPIDLLTKIYK